MSSPRQAKPKPLAFAVEWWPIGRVTPYPNNARVIPASAVEKVASSCPNSLRDYMGQNARAGGSRSGNITADECRNAVFDAIRPLE